MSVIENCLYVSREAAIRTIKKIIDTNTNEGGINNEEIEKFLLILFIKGTDCCYKIDENGKDDSSLERFEIMKSKKRYN